MSAAQPGWLMLRFGEFHAAWCLLTRLAPPVGLPASLSGFPAASGCRKLADAVWAFPLIGALIGTFAAVTYWGALTLGLPAVLAVVAALVAATVITGALHEDGLADSADGFWGGATPKRRLEIMHDSRIGSFGVLALVYATSARAGALVILPPDGVVLIVIIQHALARAVIGLPLYFFAPAQSGGRAASVGRPSPGRVVLALLLGAAPLLVLFPVSTAAIVLGAAVFSALAVGWLARGKIGGVSGDTHGAAEQIAEIAILWSFAALLVP